jgi:hypothetical protein
MRTAGARFPSEIDGRQSRELLARFLDVLSAACAPEDRAELAALTPWLLELPGKTAPQMVELLERASWQ